MIAPFYDTFASSSLEIVHGSCAALSGWFLRYSLVGFPSKGDLNSRYRDCLRGGSESGNLKYNCLPIGASLQRTRVGSRRAKCSGRRLRLKGRNLIQAQSSTSDRLRKPLSPKDHSTTVASHLQLLKGCLIGLGCWNMLRWFGKLHG